MPASLSANFDKPLFSAITIIVSSSMNHLTMQMLMCQVFRWLIQAALIRRMVSALPGKVDELDNLIGTFSSRRAFDYVLAIPIPYFWRRRREAVTLLEGYPDHRVLVLLFAPGGNSIGEKVSSQYPSQSLGIMPILHPALLYFITTASQTAVFALMPTE